jgi:hypothetical protein
MIIYILQLITIVLVGVGIAIFLNAVDAYKKTKCIPLVTCGSNKTPIITLSQGSYKYNFIVDTGSCVSAIDEKYITELGAIRLNKTTEVVGIEGNPEEVHFYEIDFECNNTAYTHDVIAKSFGNAFDPFLKEFNLEIHGILGSEFFTKHKFIIDFKTNTLNV